MAETREIVITIRNEGQGGATGGSGQGGQIVTASSGTQSAAQTGFAEWSGGQSGIEGGAGEALRLTAWAALGAHIAKMAAEIAVQAVDYGLTRRFALADDYRAQSTYNAAKAGASYGARMMGYATAFAAGIASQNYVGAAASLVAAGVDTVRQQVTFQQAVQSQNDSIRVAQYQVDFGRQAVGYSLISEGRGTDR